MSVIVAIMTVAEADIFLAAYPDWLALSTVLKDLHISHASLYVQTRWSCAVEGVDIDWSDTAAVPEEIKNACALYALADSLGYLYGDVTSPDDRRTKKELLKVGSITVSEEFASSGSKQVGTKASFGLPDSLMSIYCTKMSSGTQTLLRN